MVQHSHTNDYIKGLTFTYVNHMREVVDRALLSQKVDAPLTIEAT